jgi:hypothetical protein
MVRGHVRVSVDPLAQAPAMRALIVLLIAGYIMPGYSILRRMANKRDELALSSYRVGGTVTVAPAAAAQVSQALGVQWTSGELPLTGTFWAKLPGRCRFELSSLESTRTLAASAGKKAPEFAALQVAVDEACALLAYRGAGEGESRAAVERHLASLKVDSRQVSLGRFAGVLVFVLGDADKPNQFHVYKESASGDPRFQPARLKFTDASGTAWDVRFLDYASQGTGDTFPRQLEVWRGAELMLRFAAQKADVGVKLEDALF